MKNTQLRFTTHAFERFKERAKFLGLNVSKSTFLKLLKKAKPEKPNKKTKWELFKRSIKHGQTIFLTNKGWRFVVDPKTDTVITVERVNPHENHLKRIFEND